MKLTEQQLKDLAAAASARINETIQNAIKDAWELFESQEMPETQSGRWKPELRQRYYTRTGFGRQWLDDQVDLRNWQTDGVHQTREEAEKVQAMYRAWYKFRAMADWKEGLRYVVALYPEGFGIAALPGNPGTPSFASKESCERAIEAAGRENLKAYLERQEWIWRLGNEPHQTRGR